MDKDYKISIAISAASGLLMGFFVNFVVGILFFILTLFTIRFSKKMKEMKPTIDARKREIEEKLKQKEE